MVTRLKKEVSNKIVKKLKINMATDQIGVGTIEAEVLVIAVTLSEGICRARSEPRSTGPKIGGLTLRQSIVSWGSMKRFVELRNIRLKVYNILQSYDINNADTNSNYQMLARQTRLTIHRALYMCRARIICYS